MRPKQHLKPNCAPAQAGQSKSPERQIYKDHAKYWTLYVPFKHPSKNRGRAQKTNKKQKAKKRTRCVPKNKARSAQKAQGGKSPWRQSHSCPPSAPAATPPPLRVSSLANYNRGDKAQGSKKTKRDGASQKNKLTLEKKKSKRKNRAAKKHLQKTMACPKKRHDVPESAPESAHHQYPNWP